MTSPVTLVNTTSDTWQVLIDRVNTLANLASNAMVTVSGSANGSVTTGNAYVNGVLGVLTLAVGSLRGGNVQSAAALSVVSNVAVGNSFLYTSGAAAFSNVTVGNVVVTNSGVSVGVVSMNTTMLAVNSDNVSTYSTRMGVAKNTSTTYERSKINFVAGGTVSITVTDDGTDGQVNVAISATSSATNPGGANGLVQFNDSGVFAGASGLGWNKTSNNLTVSNNVLASGGVGVDDGQAMLDHVTVTTSGTTAQLVDSWVASTYRAAFYNVSVKNNSANGYHVTQINLLQDGSDSHMTEYGSMYSNGSLGVFSANVSAGTVRLYFAPTSAAATFRAQRTLIVV